MTQGLNQAHLPPPNATKPFWRSEQHELDSYESAALPESCDILIIGGGYAGISAAYHLLCSDTPVDPTTKIVLIEAREACSGATARNGGHVRPSVYSRLTTMINDSNLQDAEAVADFELDHIQAFEELVNEHRIDCDFTRCYSYDIYTDLEEASRAKADFDSLRKMKIAQRTLKDIEWYEGEEAEKMSGVKGCVACFRLLAAKVWPYKVFMHLLSLAMDRGLNLQTYTGALSLLPLSEGDGAWEINTTRGSISAKKVIVTTNAYTSALLPEYKDKIFPAKSTCCHIVLPDGVEAPKLPDSYGLRLPGGSLDYLIQRPDGSIIVGGGRSAYYKDRTQWLGVTDDSTLIEPTKHYFDNFMQEHFSAWQDTGAFVKSIWTGIVSYNSDSLPHAGEVPGRKNVWIAGGFQGHGMPVIWLMMKGIAKMIAQGPRWEESGIPNVYRTSQERLNSTRNDLAEVPDLPVDDYRPDVDTHGTRV